MTFVVREGEIYEIDGQEHHAYPELPFKEPGFLIEIKVAERIDRNHVYQRGRQEQHEYVQAPLQLAYDVRAHGGGIGYAGVFHI